MDLEAIERILREGPPDEPAYVPGSFHRTREPRGWLLSSVAVVLALAVGVLAGVGLHTLRDQGPRTGSPHPLSSSDLEGVWMSEPVSSDALVDELVGQGFDRDEVASVLNPSSFEQVQYTLRFMNGRLTIMSRLDDGPLETNSGGAFTLRDDDTLVYAEEVVEDPGLGDSCNSLTAQVERQSDELVITDVQLPEEICGRAVKIIHAAFFTSAPFHRSTGP